MKILIFGLNYAPEPVGIGLYSGEMARALVAAGHEVHVVAGKPYYPQWAIHDGFRGWGYTRSSEGGVQVTRCPLYVPAEPGGVKRIIHHLSFAASAIGPMLGEMIRFRPDVVMTIAPSLIAAPIASAAARLCGARSWLHVQDFEAEAAFATGLIENRGGLARLALAFQNRVIHGFDICSSISQAMCAKLIGLGIPQERVVEFRNWTDLDRVLVRDQPRSSSYHDEWSIGDRRVALYSGNIANKQGIGLVVDAARLLRARDDILFVICGDGPQKLQLMEQATDLSNIRFEPLQPIERLGDLLGLASVHLLPQLAEAADLVLPSKLTNMLASGRPIVATAVLGTALANEVEGRGIITTPGDTPAFAAAIEAIIDDPQTAASYGAEARSQAERKWSAKSILPEFIRQLESLDAG